MQVFVSMPLLVLVFGHKIFDGPQNFQYYIICVVIFFVNILETFPVYYFVVVEGFAVSLQKRIKDFSRKGITKVMPIMLKYEENKNGENFEIISHVVEEKLMSWVSKPTCTMS